MSSADWSTKAIIIIQHALTSIVGIVGNVLVLIVYKKRLRDKETITFFIVHLALTDLACCLFLIPLNCYHELYIGAITSDFMCKFHSFLNIVNITYSCLLMTLVACERCFSIVYPFRRIVTKTRAKFAMAGLFAFCFGIALTSCLGIGIYHRVHRVFANFDVLNYNLSDFYNDYHLPPPNSQSQPSPSNIDYYAASAMASPMATLTTTRSFQNRHGKQLRGVVVANNMILHKREIVSDYGFVISPNRSKREMMPISNVTQWMKTTNCFPNDQIIPLQYISYLRLFQNLIVVGCFTTIFVLYALICVRVTQRRQLKADRDQYYKELLDRSKRNTMMVNAAPETSPKTFEKRNSREKKASSSSNHQLHMMTHEISDPLLGTATTITNDLKSLSSMHDQETSLVAPLPNISSPDVENTKSTQTVKSSISYIKNSQSVSSNMAANGAANQKRSMSMSKVKSQSISNQRVRSSCCSQNQNNVNGGEASPKKACGRLDALTHHQSISNQSQPDQSSVYAQARYTNALLANLKTAFMLFVVTLIMAIVYTPSLLTSLHIIDYNPIHWNIIYINNAVNPIVYSFLNYNFRKNLKTTLKFAWNRLFRSNSDLDLTK